MAAPTVRSVGTFASDTSSPITPGTPAGAEAGDLFIAVVESTQTSTTGGTCVYSSGSQTWVKLFEEAQGDGANGVTSLSVWACLFTGSGNTSFSVQTAQNHIHGQIISIQTGTHGVSNPSTDIVVGTGAGSAGTSLTLPGITVTADSLILGCFAVTDDANDSDNITAFTNANLANITEQFDQGTNGGAGGGIVLWTGTRAGTTTGDSSATHDSFTAARYVHLGIKPSGQNASVTPAAVIGTAAVNAPTVTTQRSASVTPGAVIGTAFIINPTTSISVSRTPATVVGTAQVNTPPTSAGASVIPSAVIAAVVIPTATVVVTANVSIIPNTVVVIATIQTPSPVVGNANAPPAAVAATVTVPTAIVTVAGDAAVTPSAVAATVTVPTATIAASAATTPPSVAATATVSIPSVQGGATVVPSAVAATSTVPTATVSAIRNASVTPAAVVGTAQVNGIRVAFSYADAHFGPVAHVKHHGTTTDQIPIIGAITALRLVQVFTVEEDTAITAVDLYVRRSGDPTDSLRVGMLKQIDGGTWAISDVVASTIPTDFSWVRFKLDTPFSVTAGTTYYVRVTRTGGSDQNRCEWLYRQTSNRWGSWSWTSGTGWVEYTPRRDFVLRLYADGAVSATTTVLSSTVEIDTPVTATTIVGTGTVPTPVVTAVRNASVTPSPVVGTATVQTPIVSAGGAVNVIPSAVVGTVSVPSATVEGDAAVTPSAVAGAATVVTPSVTASATAQPDAVQGTGTVPQPVVTTAGDAFIVPSPVVGTASVPTPSAAASVSVVPTPVVAKVAVPPSDYAAVVLADSPTGYWRLGESAGPTADDEAGTNDGTYYGGAGVTYGEPGVTPPDTAVKFNGSGTGVTLPAGIMDLDTTTSPKAVECWFKTKASTAALFGARDSTLDQPVFDVSVGDNGATIDPGKLTVLLRDNDGGSMAALWSPLRYDDGNWHHVVVTIDASKQVRLYADGALVAGPITNPADVATTMDTPLLGDESRNSRIVNLDGTLDEAAVYDYALSEAQVIDHFGRPPVPTVSADASVTPAAVAGTATVPTATVTAQANASVTPSPVVGTAVVQVPNISAGGNVSVSPSPVVGTATVPSSTISAGASRTPAAVVGSAAVPNPVAQAGATVTSPPVVGAAAVPMLVPSVGGDAHVSLSPVVGTAQVPTPAITAGSRVTPPVVVGTATVLAPTMATDANFTTTAVVATAVVPEATVIIRVKGSLTISDRLANSATVSDESTATCTLLDSLVGRIIVSDS